MPGGKFFLFRHCFAVLVIQLFGDFIDLLFNSILRTEAGKLDVTFVCKLPDLTWM